MTESNSDNNIICKKCGYANPPESPFEFFISLKHNYCKSCNTKFESHTTVNLDKRIPLRNFRRFYASIMIALAIGSLYAFLSTLFGFKFEVDRSVFQVVIEVMAIFFGFQILGIFYYLGKLDNQKRDFLQISGRFKENIEKAQVVDKDQV
jgi:hypothetical protein